jgi:hypothetical protein
MAMKTYTVTLRDGSTDSRKSARPYTHAITVEYTQVYLDSVITKYEREIAADEALIVSLTDEAATDAAKDAYAAASKDYAHWNEYVPQMVTRADGTVHAYETVRWLANEHKALSHRERSPGQLAYDKATAVLHATALFRILRARTNIELAQKAIERSRERIVVGSCFVNGWSMSFRNAQKAADKAHASYPGCVVGVSADIGVREHGTRAKAPAAAAVL